jgi:PEP-CTERM motif
MKFQLKALAAAVVLAASIPAHATLTLPNTGNGSAVLVMIDSAANLVATFDTGKLYSDFNQIASAGALGTQASFSLDLANNANYSATWAAFLANGGSLTNAQYAFVAADNNGAGVGQQGYVASFASPGAAAQTSSPVGTAAGNLNLALTNVDFVGTLQSNLNTSSNPGAALQSSVGQPGTVGVYAGGKLGNTGGFIFANLGTTMGFEQYVLGTSTVAQAGKLLLPASASTPTFSLLNNGLFTYSVAAVPEADTWAMAMLGVGFMGFVARRKQA